MRNRYHLLSCILIVIVSACSVGQSAFNKGNYYDATLKAVKHLRKKPDSEKALALIQKSYPMALEYHQQRIDALGRSNEPNKFMKIVDEYAIMNRMADEITRCPAALDAVKPVVYFHDQQNKAEQMALDEQFGQAMAMLGTQNVDDARAAYKRFQWIKKRSPNYPDIDSQLAMARDMGTLKVVVESLPVKNMNYRVDSRVFYVRLYDQLSNNATSNFLKFYQPHVAEELHISPHEVVKVHFLEFNIEALHETSRVQEFVSDSIEIGTYTDSNGNEFPVLGTVKAKAEVFDQELRSKLLLQIDITDFRTGEIIQSRKFPSDYVWHNKWAMFNGDERALPVEILKMTKNKQQNPPEPQEMFLLTSDRVFANASSFLKSYYKY